MPINVMNPCVHQLGHTCRRCGHVAIPARFYGPEGIWSHEKATAGYEAWKRAGKPSPFDGTTVDRLSLQGENVPTDMSLHSNDVPTEAPKVVVPSEQAPNLDVMTTGPLPSPSEAARLFKPPLCADCGARPREGRYKTCAACRKRAQRAK